MASEQRERRPTTTLRVCKDFLRDRCSRFDCKFAHPAPSNIVDPSPDGDVVVVCNDYLRGRCSREASCKYLHAPPHLVEVLMEKVGLAFPPGTAPPAVLRQDLLRNGPPPRFAPPPPLPPSFLTSLPGFLPPEPLPLHSGLGSFRTQPVLEVCRDYLRDKCSRSSSECRFAHTQPNAGDGNLVTVCQDFLKNRCERDNCRYFHPDSHLRPRIQDIPVSSRRNRSPERLPYLSRGGDYDYLPPSKRNRLDNGYDRPSSGLPPAPPLGGYGAYGSPTDPISMLSRLPIDHMSLPPPGTAFLPPHRPVDDKDRLPVCRDFLKNRCERPNCRFVHPPDYVEILDNLVVICRDASRGKCQRERCRFFHATS